MKDIKILLKNVKNKNLLLVFPHPDDESFACAGLIMLSKNLGYTVNLITLTQGGAGKIYINPRGRSLKEIRHEELIKATRLLEINNFIIKDFDDAKLRQKNGWSKWLSEKITKIDPGVIVTYDHTGITGHPDHIRVSLFVNDIVKDGHFITKPIILWPVLSQRYSRFMPKELKKYIPKPQYVNYMGTKGAAKKVKVISVHKSQKNKYWRILFSLILLTRKEWYHEVDLNKDYPFKYIDFKFG